MVAKDSYQNDNNSLCEEKTRLTLTADAQGGTFLAEWVIKLTQFEFNQKIDPNAFSISAK